MTKNNLKVVKTAKDKELENKEKNKALDAAISQITDSFGKGSVMKLGEQKAMDVESVSTGSLSLDLALGIGGLPKGRIIEIYGPESSGKTTLALQVVAEAQKAGGICAFVDPERNGLGRYNSRQRIQHGHLTCRKGGESLNAALVHETLLPQTP